jgi:hypothetical protein
LTTEPHGAGLPRRPQQGDDWTRQWRAPSIASVGPRARVLAGRSGPHRPQLLVGRVGFEAVGDGAQGLSLLTRYAESLTAVRSRLTIVSASDRVREQLELAGITALIGEENIYIGDERVGAAVKRANADALDWIAAGGDSGQRDQRLDCHDSRSWFNSPHGGDKQSPSGVTSCR